MPPDLPSSTLAHRLPSVLPTLVSSPQARPQLRRKLIVNPTISTSQLARHLTVRDLTGLGIAAIIGAGIFSTIGQASLNGGPAVALLFVFTAVACAFSALCYAQFAATIPVSGSAYTYAYASFGELAAWVIGWALIMEYTLGNIVVAISWSDYFTGLLQGIGINIPLWLTMGTQSAHTGYKAVQALLQVGKPLTDAAPAQLEAYWVWVSAPELLGGWRLVLDLPAFLITSIRGH
jgi:APA family basic amino acid/polyamine antiporter